MIRHQRPPKPDSFDSHPGVVAARTATRQKVESGDPPRSKDFASCWSDFKAVFAAAQHGKCGFCEGKVLATGHGEVEHYRPKAEVRELPVDRAELGTPAPYQALLANRTRGTLVVKPGYWWLAHTWDNWLFACAVCNHLKGNFFPIRESPRGEHVEGCESQETPLLLNPFEGPDPGKLLTFSIDGFIAASDGNSWGNATIDACGLHRFELTQERRILAYRVQDVLVKLFEPLNSQRREELLDELGTLGQAEHAFAGLVRSLVETSLECDWDELF